ncbi:fimbrial biogenesis chaperone [Klebsiella pneumoniae]|uniref:fimbrial biogenesis chaperone n=1 Tax=Klebsiella pneumoniae TaxID=573 RepID=UPI002380921D|nr:molecular chaperone [Klebsiella pneumoniae]MDE4727946.1 molecular chaperone [Klebsiella pneumoniae]MDE4738993.1 molecular chaperone [Klebsiella pneumoniae]
MIFKNQMSFFCLFFLLCGVANANVVMTGTRVIFPSESKEKIIQFTNTDAQPYLMQVQITNKDGKENKQSPFVFVPPVFRIEGHSGQSVRLIANGTQKLPQDRESVFYLNFTQLPVMKQGEQANNQLILAISNRVKIFYRPTQITKAKEEPYKEIVFSLSGDKIIVDNRSPYYINIRNAELVNSRRSASIANSVMLEPKSVAQWKMPSKISTLSGSIIKLTMVNDYGADVISERKL